MLYADYTDPPAETTVSAGTTLYTLPSSTPWPAGVPVLSDAVAVLDAQWKMLLEKPEKVATRLARLGALMDALGRAVPVGDHEREQYAALYDNVGRLLAHDILPALARRGLRVYAPGRLSAGRLQWARTYFLRRLYPLLTPLAVDPGRPFPRIAAGSTNLLVALQTPEQAARRSVSMLYACVEAPAKCAPLIRLPVPEQEAGADKTAGQPHLADGARRAVHSEAYIWTADLIRYFIHELFPGMIVRNVYLFRALRDPAWTCDDELHREGEWQETRQRTGSEGRMRPARRVHEAPVSRLELEHEMPGAVAKWLADHLHAAAPTLVRVPHALEVFGLAGLTELTCALDLGSVAGAQGRDEVWRSEAGRREFLQFALQSV